MKGLYLWKKSLRSSLFFFTPLFLPQWGKLNTTRSNRRPCSVEQPPSCRQSTSNSTDPPEETTQEKLITSDTTVGQMRAGAGGGGGERGGGCQQTHCFLPDLLMMSMLSAAPWCRSASSSLCRQVAVMLVAADAASCWHREAENEKFPSPTSRTRRGGDMCKAKKERKEKNPEGKPVGLEISHFRERVPPNVLLSSLKCRGRKQRSPWPRPCLRDSSWCWTGEVRLCVLESLVSPSPSTHCGTNPLTFSCSPAALLRTQSVRLHLWETECHNESGPTGNMSGRSSVSTLLHVLYNGEVIKIPLECLCSGLN